MAGRTPEITAARGAAIVTRSATQQAARSFLRHRPGMVALGVVLLLAAVAALAPAIAPYDWNAQDIVHRFNGPSAAHALGTDELGRDI